MLQVSEQYKNSMKSTLRNASRVNIRVLDVNADYEDVDYVNNLGNLNYAEDSKKLIYPYPTELDCSYWTGEHNQFIIGDKIGFKHSESLNSYARGFISSGFPTKVEIENNELSFIFQILPTSKIILTFDHTISVDGFYAKAQMGNDYIPPRFIDVTMYNGEEIVFEGDIVEKYTFDTPLLITGLTITCLSSSYKMPPWSRVHLEQLCLGREFTFNNNNITRAEWKEEVDPISRRLPIQTLKFSAIDYEGEFDAIKPHSLYDFVDTGYDVFLEYGYDVNDQSTEWFAPQRYVLESKPNFSNGIVSFSCVKYDNRYSSNTYEEFSGSNNLWAKTLEICNKAGITNEEIGYLEYAHMQKFNVSVPFKNSTKVIDNLQNIAHATGCAMKFDQFGRVTMCSQSEWYKPCDFQLDRSTVVKDSEVLTINPELRNLYINVYGITSEDSLKRRVSLSVVNGDDSVVDFGLPMAHHDRTYSGLTTAMRNGIGCYNELYHSTYTGNAYIEGYTYNIENSKRLFKVSNNGEDENIDNYLISDPNNIRFLADSVYIPYLKSRKVIRLSYRGNPELECGDTFIYTDKYGYKHNVILLSNTISFNGAIRGTMIIKEI
ncbi:MAG: hypothetical protein MJ126_05620 [Lachnospiraceae bacterium]|nr:hypothetical protein [Lachnospiraceae bacterium]